MKLYRQLLAEYPLKPGSRDDSAIEYQFTVKPLVADAAA